MRIKAVPQMAIKAVSAHPYILGGALAVTALIGYRYYMASGDFAADSGGLDYANSAFAYTYGMPMVVPGGSGGGIVDSVGGGGAVGDTAGGGVNQSALLDFEILKEGHDYDLASRTLDANLAIAAVNADVAMAGLATQQLQAQMGLAQSFLNSTSQFMVGQIGDLTFQFLGTKAQNPVHEWQYKQFNLLLKNAGVQSLFGLTPQTGPTNVTSTLSSLNVSSLSGATSSGSSGSSGGSSFTSAGTSSAGSSGGTSTGDGGSFEASAFRDSGDRTAF